MVANGSWFPLDGDLKKQTVISLGIIAAVVVLNLVNLARNEKPRNSREEIRSPAQDSAEWLRRYGEREHYQQALPELPPEPEWAGIISKLREALGSLRCIPITAKNVPTQVMTHWVHTGKLPAEFELGEECELQAGKDGAVDCLLVL
ncbi:MAG: hypothetical protein EOP88_26950 [Verrucomicrobiaceae bacterium]|nr:MAG: hypothetical protein EOP88_26950 [Verrucomicrobiaceae bacterium]